MRSIACWVLLTVSCFIVSPALADITGRATVIDGDTIEIHNKRIRLHGVDAPESRQSCFVNGEPWRCGQKSALALADYIGTATVRCEEHDQDRYGRIVAVCFREPDNINSWLVRQGWAVDYQQYSNGEYRGEEALAKQARLGVWRGQFTMPWDWRRGARLSGASGQKQERKSSKELPGQCRIKGNISSRGARIYHVPGGQYYDRTRISTSKGERWFCSEAEARAAGWRRSKR